MQMRFKYLVEDVDRHGNVRIYVRVPGRRKVRLRAKFGTDEFLAAYILHRGYRRSPIGPAAGTRSQARIVPPPMHPVLRQRDVRRARSGNAGVAPTGSRHGL